MKITLENALRVLLPRYNRGADKWPLNGVYGLFNTQVTPKNIDRSIHKIMGRYDRSGLVPIIKWIDVSGDNVWTLQRNVKTRGLNYFLKRLWAWQYWSIDRLPVFVLYSGKIVVWNGTHRTVIGRLFGKRIRGRVIDLNMFARWVKANPDESMWNVVKVVNIKGKKRGRPNRK